jgi:hypothetical protein
LTPNQGRQAAPPRAGERLASTRGAVLPRIGGLLSALGPACLCHCSAASAVEQALSKDLTAQCNSLSDLDQPGACIDVGSASLGEVFAISLDGGEPPKSLGVLAPTGPASSSQLATAPPVCIDVLTAPVNAGPTGVDLARQYQLPAFTTQLFGGIADLTVQLNVDIAGKAFNLELGPMTSASLDDPARLLSCSPGAVSAVRAYWDTLTPAQQGNTGLFLVDKIVSTDFRSITASDGTSISLVLSGFRIADYQFSVSYECAQLTPADAGSPVFFDGQVFSFDPVTSAFSFAQSPLSCKVVE